MKKQYISPLTELYEIAEEQTILRDSVYGEEGQSVDYTDDNDTPATDDDGWSTNNAKGAWFFGED